MCRYCVIIISIWSYIGIGIEDSYVIEKLPHINFSIGYDHGFVINKQAYPQLFIYTFICCRDHGGWHGMQSTSFLAVEDAPGSLTDVKLSNAVQ